MTLFAERSYSRVMVFIDYQNVLRSIRVAGEGTRMDLFRLTQILVGSRYLVGAYVFDAKRFGAGEYDHNVMMQDRLREQGFRVIVRESLVMEREGEHLESGSGDDGGRRGKQKEVDVSLACELLEHALLDHYDVAIVVSGDRDFVPAMQKVQNAGKRVEVAAYGNSCSEESKRTADLYYLLDDLPFLSMYSSTEGESL